MALIDLTGGGFAVVDDEDFEYLSQWKWFRARYAIRGTKTKINGKWKNKTHFMHREIMELHGFKYGDKMVTDHINGDTFDNRKENLRIVTNRQNAFNQKKNGINKTSIYKGVRKVRNRPGWEANIWTNGKNKYIGYFQTEIEAALAYNSVANSLFEEYARLNEVI